MMSHGSRYVRLGLAAAVVCALSGLATAQTTSYELRSGEVLAVNGNNLIVNGPDGVKEFVIADDFTFDMDGKALTVHQLKPGMKLTALITTTTTPIDLTLTELRDAEVIYTNGSTVVLRNSDDGKYRRFTNEEMKEMDLVVYKDGRVVPPSALRKGDRISAVIVTKLPPSEVTEQEISVLAQNAPPAPPKPVPPPPTAAAPPPPAPAVAQVAPPPPPPKALPKTASPLPLVGLIGGLAVAAGLGLTIRRRLARH